MRWAVKTGFQTINKRRSNSADIFYQVAYSSYHLRYRHRAKLCLSYYRLTSAMPVPSEMPPLYRTATELHRNISAKGEYSARAIWYPAHPLIAFVRPPASAQPLEREFALVLPAGYAGQDGSICVFRDLSDKIPVTEAQVSMDWHGSAMGRVPWSSFALLLQIERRHIGHVRHMGEYAPPQNGKSYHQIALRIGAFRDILSCIADPDDMSSISLVCYCLPAFIFPYGSAFAAPRFDLFRNDGLRMSTSIFKADFSLDPKSRGWIADKTYSVEQIAQGELRQSSHRHLSEVPEVPEHLEAIMKMPNDRIDRELTSYKGYIIDAGRTCEDEILKHMENGTSTKDKRIPPRWPRRLLDVILNAVLPGENIWDF